MPQAFKIVSHKQLKWLECAQLSRLPWLLHAFSMRPGGASGPPVGGLSLGLTKFDCHENVEENYRRFFESIGARPFLLAGLQQIHSANVFQVTQALPGVLQYAPAGLEPVSQNEKPGARAERLGPSFKSRIPNPDVESLPRQSEPAGDALMTRESGILLCVRTADCMPILLVDPGLGVVAVVHAGWRGTLHRIVEKTVGEMRRVFGSCAGDLLAAIGPCIRSCCYEVGPAVADAFRARFAESGDFLREPAPDTAVRSVPRRNASQVLTTKPPGRSPESSPALYLDLVAVAQRQLLSAGLAAPNILVSEFCTACSTNLFFSHRKEGGSAGRLLAVIGLRPQGCRPSLNDG